MFVSSERLSNIFDTLIDIKEFCLEEENCLECPFRKSPICREEKPCDWIVNNPNKPIFKFF